jgi:23S rRNA (adenine2503-C2)-methyltransferase
MQEIFGLSLAELQTALAALGMQKYRAGQVFKWLYQKAVFDFAAMTDLGAKNVALLKENFTVLPNDLKVVKELKSEDGLTRKLLIELTDGNTIESVLMHHDYGYSVCVSSQVGCDMHCAFCASGLNGCVRNLTRGEILAQVYLFEAFLHLTGEHVRRIVVMGSGEPLLNFQAVFEALEFLHEEQALYISYRNMTVSTCGIVPGIERMQALGVPINLALSLHSVRPEVRTQLMPVNVRYPFQESLAAVAAYAKATGRQATCEYILLAGKNDSEEDAELLSNFLRYKLISVNLIPVNPVPEKGFLRPGKKKIERFLQILERNHINATVRKEMGQDINAACGQLRAQQLLRR